MSNTLPPPYQDFEQRSTELPTTGAVQTSNAHSEPPPYDTGIVNHCRNRNGHAETSHSMEKRKKSVYLSEIEFSGLKPAKTSKTRLKKCFY